jgi:hypothetical protein
MTIIMVNHRNIAQILRYIVRLSSSYVNDTFPYSRISTKLLSSLMQENDANLHSVGGALNRDYGGNAA